MGVQTQIQLRRGTAAQWTSANPTLAAGEMAVETDTKLFKIGDGATAWTSLGYASIPQGTGFSVSSQYNVPTLKSPKEITTVSATAATGTVNFDYLTQGVLYYTTNSSANFTLNIRGNSTTALNSVMNTGDAVTVAFLNTNGSTAYYANAFTIDGTSVSPKWQGGTAPSAGNASAIDSYTLTIIKTGSAAYTVLAALTKFA